MWLVGSFPLIAARVASLVELDLVRVQIVDGCAVTTHTCKSGHAHVEIGAFAPYTIALLAFMHGVANAHSHVAECTIEEALGKVWALAGDLVPDNERGDMRALYLRKPPEPSDGGSGYMH